MSVNRLADVGTKKHDGSRWIDKDPVIDLLRTEAQREYGRLTERSIKNLALRSGLSSSTLWAWFHGDTRHPKNLSTKFVKEALGIRTRLFRADGSEILSNHN